MIDDWFTNRPLALLFEAKVGKGKLLVSGIDFAGYGQAYGSPSVTLQLEEIHVR